MIELLRVDRPWSDYPLGTRAYAINGGLWTRVVGWWKWSVGDIFPTPGGEACRHCIEMPKEPPQT